MKTSTDFKTTEVKAIVRSFHPLTAEEAEKYGCRTGTYLFRYEIQAIEPNTFYGVKCNYTVTAEKVSLSCWVAGSGNFTKFKNKLHKPAILTLVEIKKNFNIIVGFELEAPAVDTVREDLKALADA